MKAIVQNVTGIGADIAIEVVGSQVAAALDVIRKGGKVLLFGINMKAAPTISPSSITVKEAQILGTWLANASFPRAVEILEKGIIDLEPLITHRVSAGEDRGSHRGAPQGRRGKGVHQPAEGEERRNGMIVFTAC